ncbi:RNA polymerase III subunit [Talaromyces pinophilus]|uniref:DNA-directed RNA polymerase subunit n=3 Tax=Talaromyces sect. Talaromyces TaxID=2752537 RepID=B6Q634_TALMQ|nr:uncharacterized protein BHQ10_000414 [Talaromyces amestolkiae]XP_054116149.1 uncharacterized protein EYB26_000860 [Talaromyces marneffei]EEA27529.1 RNA polymerase III subunit C11, putative [Talaromyces marneffei ATCC 18224]GAM39228.1 RNA polymerase III subunit [Talaromyces pinophilus]KAE8556772.1 hypothetical protein EYB25_001476 [Talaromyces marneffei]QGA13213.1 hypothetical protein EYB26_000860 [Talaromyces marneffei]RAO64402.1 hypothetical protein BHQ10_000414 [Talaromyces amestolkiae]
MPLTFCPHCSNALTVSRADPSTAYPMGVNRFQCRTCPYQFVIDRLYVEEKVLKQKEVEVVFNDEEMFKNADKLPVQCPSDTCNGEYAYFYQLQIRSADEPMTTFLRCTTCAKTWRD